MVRLEYNITYNSNELSKFYNYLQNDKLERTLTNGNYLVIVIDVLNKIKIN